MHEFIFVPLINGPSLITMPNHWVAFVQQLQRLAANSLVLRNMKHVTPDSLLPFDLKSNKGFKLLSPEFKTTRKLELNAVMAAAAGSVQSCNDTWSLLWLPIDLVLEDAMDGDNVAETSVVQVLSGLVKALKAVNGTAWHKAFLGLWIAALRLVQRVSTDPTDVDNLKLAGWQGFLYVVKGICRRKYTNMIL
ncbi:mediator of RNA polymerase II transcription subunit 33A-like [Arachis ipaensis]|uniref:mediator of RNA polymerase II transcription subunit 33A-like n=1 Tax=Arachis ipaensis TaxID=130454 RepID=UPI000A2AF8E1|nr:mediator of RNA polymerase II transcription subunit 33A-like [Arachis ipaensis]